MSGWASIVNASEGDFNKLTEAIANSDGTAKSMADTMMGGAKGALTEMKSALEGVAITIGERLTPFIEKLADGISKLCTWFQSLSPETQTFIMIVAGLLAILGPLLIIIGSAISLFANLSIVAGALGISIGALCSPFLIAIGIIGAIIAVGYLLVSNWDWIKEKAVEVGKIVSDAWNGMCDWISEACSNIGKWISDTWNSVCDWTSSAWEAVCNFVQVGVMLIGSILSAAFQIITLPWQFIWENCKDIIIPIWEAIKTFISDQLEKIKTFISDTWKAVKDATSTVWEGVKTVISTIVGWIKENIVTKFNEMKNKVVEVFNEIKKNITDKFNEVKTNISNKVNEIKTSISNGFNEAKNKVSEIFGNIKKGIEDKINGAKDAVGKAIEKIKGFFNFSWELPKLKLPHISITGSFSLSPPSVPKFGISWYSKGAIFKRPTVLGGMGIGDRHNGIGSNAEAILPINQLPKLLGLDKMQNGGVNLNIENFNNNTDKDIEYLANELAFYMNRKRIGIGGAY